MLERMWNAIAWMWNSSQRLLSWMLLALFWKVLKFLEELNYWVCPLGLYLILIFSLLPVCHSTSRSSLSCPSCHSKLTPLKPGAKPNLCSLLAFKCKMSSKGSTIWVSAFQLVPPSQKLYTIRMWSPAHKYGWQKQDLKVMHQAHIHPSTVM